jgi:uncharacterized protein (TIGR03086 family)
MRRRYDPSMSENLRMFTKALYGFDHVARLLPDKAWDRKSPCDGWTARHVAGHVIGSVRIVESYALGKQPNMKALSDPVKVAGADPLAAFAKARDAALAALDRPGVLNAVEPTFFGAMPMDAFIKIMGADVVVHTWDAARAGRVDERLDAALCKTALGVYKQFPKDMLRQPGIFGPEVRPAQGSDAQTKLLNFLGRSR